MGGLGLLFGSLPCHKTWRVLEMSMRCLESGLGSAREFGRAKDITRIAMELSVAISGENSTASVELDQWYGTWFVQVSFHMVCFDTGEKAASKSPRM